MKNIRFLLLLITGLLLQAVALQAQVQYPVISNMVINQSGSTYLTDFTAPGSRLMQLNLMLNDFNETDYNVQLRLRLEGNGITLITDPNFNPAPINIQTGSNTFFGSDIPNYLDSRNMIISGISNTELETGGNGLPAGFYTICVQAFDYQRKEVALSVENCFTANLRKNYPPIAILPACESVLTIIPGNPVVQFQWQSQTDASVFVEYELSIAEVPEGIDPQDALNGTNTLILPSEPVMGTTFTYGADLVPLEVGKRYAYRTRVIDPIGNTTFENNGFSPVCSFFYGFAADQPIKLISPKDKASSLGVEDQLNFAWERPVQARSDDQIYYRLKIVEIFNGQSQEDAIEFNQTWYEEGTGVIGFNGLLTLPEDRYPLPAEAAYAWQVTAYSDASAANPNALTEQIGVSEVRTFFTAPAVPKIVAGNPSENEKLITVIGLTKNEDLSTDLPRKKRISGTGSVKAKADGTEVTVDFTDIVVLWFSEDFWILIEGEIIQPLKDFTLLLDNSGESSEAWDFNGHAEFDANTLIIEKDNTYLKGRVKWHLPHPTTAGDVAIVQSIDKQVLYNGYKLLDNYVDVEDTRFDLLDPYGFTIHYFSSDSSATNFAVTDDVLTLTLDGTLTTPESITDINDKRVDYTFFQANNPWYFSSEEIAANKDIRLISNTTMQLDGQTAIFDLSETESPDKITDSEWKGLYFPSFQLLLPTDFDGSGQVVLDEEQSIPFALTNDNDFKAWVDVDGIQFQCEKEWEGSTGPTAAFNTFKDNFRKINMEIEDSGILDSYLKGFVYIPLIGDEEEFAYTTPFDQNGMQVSTLDEDISGRKVVLNKGEGDQEMTITINDAIFEDNDHLSMNVDLQWDSVFVKSQYLDNFNLWGSGDIGFVEKNGASPVTNVEGIMQNLFSIEVYSFFAEVVDGIQEIGFKATTGMGPEISGPDGPPEVKLKSEKKSYLITGKDLDGKDLTELSAAKGWTAPKININIKKVLRIEVAKLKFIVNGKFGTDNNGNWIIGTGFAGDIGITIMQPKKRGIKAIFTYGKTAGSDGFDFWKVQISASGSTAKPTPVPKLKRQKALSGKELLKDVPTDEEILKDRATEEQKTVYKDGEPETQYAGVVYLKSEKATPGYKPKEITTTPCNIKLGPITFTEIGGAIYRNMKYNQNGQLIPSEDVWGGFGLLVGGEGGGGAWELTAYVDCMFKNSSFALEQISGGLNGKVAKKVKLEARFQYNPDEEHFVCTLVADGEEGYCFHAPGFLNLRGKNPKKLNVSLGRENDKFKIGPCIGKQVAGWLVFENYDTDKSAAESFTTRIELGLGFGKKFEVKRTIVDITAIKVEGYAKASYYMGGLAKVQAVPEFKLLKIGLWGEIDASIGFKYETAFTDGEVKLASFNAKAKLLLEFTDPPTVKEDRVSGEIKGELTIIGIDIPFAMEFAENI